MPRLELGETTRKDSCLLEGIRRSSESGAGITGSPAWQVVLLWMTEGIGGAGIKMIAGQLISGHYCCCQVRWAEGLLPHSHRLGAGASKAFFSCGPGAHQEWHRAAPAAASSFIITPWCFRVIYKELPHHQRAK